MWPPCHTHRERSFPVLSLSHSPPHHHTSLSRAAPLVTSKCTSDTPMQVHSTTQPRVVRSNLYQCFACFRVCSHRPCPVAAPSSAQRAGKHTTRSCAVPTPHRTDGGQPRLTHATRAFPTSNNLPPPPSAQARCTHDVRLCADPLPTRFPARVRDDRYDSFARDPI
jgi:hypothetical protein